MKRMNYQATLLNDVRLENRFIFRFKTKIRKKVKLETTKN